MKELVGISILIAVFCIVALIYVVDNLYFPTRDKLTLAESKITSYERKIEEYRHAEVKTAQTIQKLHNQISLDKASLDWSHQPIPTAVLNVLQDAHRTATSGHAPGDRVSQNSKN